ncbi:MAG: flagellar export protein FliJ [Solirubrobacteraceae bacterium]|nr:flagellar export protein FliJ [Solirubrobacteraceae bacterium]
MARDFKFRLQPVLDIREGAEQKAKEQLAETMALRAQGREQLRAAERLVAEADAAARDAAGLPLTIDQLAAQQRWRERLERHRLAAGQQLVEAEGEVVLSRSALVEAHQRRATLDRLKDTKAAQHRADRERIDAVEADEIALRQHHGRKRHRTAS